jgi:hypothetical protein
MKQSETVHRLEEASLRLGSIPKVDVRDGQEAVTRYLDEVKDAVLKIQEAAQAVSEGLRDFTQ